MSAIPARRALALALLTTMATHAAALPPRTDWKETIPPGEEDLVRRFSLLVGRIQEASARAGDGEVRRGFHAKMHAGVRATLRVLPDLPEHARHGVFAAPREYPAFLRFSSGQAVIQDDSVADIRGVGLKLWGVEGPRARAGGEPSSQDFLMVNRETSAVRNTHQFFVVVKNMKNKLMLPVRLQQAFGFREAARLLACLASGMRTSTHSLAATDFRSPVPIRVGPYAAKFRLAPDPAEPREPLSPREHPDYLREDLAERLRGRDLRYRLMLQFYVDPEATPIEDASVRWPEELSPWVEVAEVRIPSGDLEAPAHRRDAALVDAMAFDPWNALEAHRPLGSLMRARRRIYPDSFRRRSAGRARP